MRTHYGTAARDMLNQSVLQQIRDWAVEARENLYSYSRTNNRDISDEDSDAAKFAALANAIEALWQEY